MNDINNSREKAFKYIQDLRKQHGERAEEIHSANEAQTRVILIDKILESVGWSAQDFNAETTTASGYIDYLLSIDSIPRVVVEAKRIGTTFRSPSSSMKNNDYSLKYFRRAYGSAVSDVLDQATRYAQEKGVQFAAITNGVEWLLVQVIPPPSKNAEDLRGFYFGDLLSENSNFELFWELLSKPALLQGSIEERFSHINSSPVEDSLIAHSQFGDFRWKRPSATEELRTFYNRFFTDIVDSGRRKMLEQCFATDAQLSQYQGELKRALKDTAPNFLPSNTQDVSPEEGMEFLLDETGDKSGRVILITGSVGCGKSTLVTKVLTEARMQKLSSLITLKIDLIDEVVHEQVDVSPTLWRYISEVWDDYDERNDLEASHIDKLRKYYGREIKKWRNGQFAEVFRNDESAFLRYEAEQLSKEMEERLKFFSRCWQYHKQKGYGIALVIDNVDRASEAYQQQVYAFAHKLSKNTGATVIITLREFTFFRGQENGFLDVRPQDTVLHLQTPNLEQLISKRIKYIESSMLEDHRVSRWKKSANWADFKESALQHADMLKRTFLSSNSGRDILGLLASISWHNVRFFLEILQRVHIQLGTDNEVWQHTEVIAALLTSFDVGRTAPVLTNIYRPSFPRYRCYFLKVRILLMLMYGLPSGITRRGVSLSRILSFTRLYGYETRWTEQAVEELVKERYLECLEAPSDGDYTKNYSVSYSDSFRTSPSAITVVTHIADQPVYLCLIGNDLPFYSSSSFEDYKKSLLSVFSVLDEGMLERDAVELITDTSLTNVVANYLVNAYRYEQPAQSLMKVAEVASTELRLEQIINRLKKLANVNDVSIKENVSQPIQPSLFAPQSTESKEDKLQQVAIPDNIANLRIGRSEQGPLIFWALVALKVYGKDSSSGVEITDVINEFLVDDHNKKFTNNISRALRSPTLKSQPWLLIDSGSHPKHKKFGLKDGWQIHWKELFDTSPPSI